MSKSKFVGAKKTETPWAKIHDECLKKVVDAMLEKDDQFEACIILEQLRDKLRRKKGLLGNFSTQLWTKK